MPPVVTYQAAPAFPRGTLNPGTSTKVVVKVTIGEDGQLKQATIAQTSRNMALDSAALDAARRSKYQPAFTDCSPVQQNALFAVSFFNNDVAPRSNEQATLQAPKGWISLHRVATGARFRTVGYWQPINDNSQHITLTRTASGGTTLNVFTS